MRPDKVRSAAAIPHSLHMVVKQPMDSERVEVCVCMNGNLLRDANVLDILATFCFGGVRVDACACMICVIRFHLLVSLRMSASCSFPVRPQKCRVG